MAGHITAGILSLQEEEQVVSKQTAITQLS